MKGPCPFIFADRPIRWSLPMASDTLTEQFILASTECMGYRAKADHPSPQLKRENLPDAFIVDYVRVYDEMK